MGLFRKPTKEEIEKDITRKEIELADLRKKIEQKKKYVEDWIKCYHTDPIPTKQDISQYEIRISRLEDEITDLRKKLLRM